MEFCSAWRIYYKVMETLSLPVLTTVGMSTLIFIFTRDDFYGPLI